MAEEYWTSRFCFIGGVLRDVLAAVHRYNGECCGFRVAVVVGGYELG